MNVAVALLYIINFKINNFSSSNLNKLSYKKNEKERLNNQNVK